MLGEGKDCNKHFENTIIRGRDAEATDAQMELMTTRLADMADMVNKCIIRRTNALLVKYLPVKYEFVVCCKLSPLQEAIYTRIIKNKKRELEGLEEEEGKAHALSFIINMKKLCNHPQLITEMCKQKDSGFEGKRFVWCEWQWMIRCVFRLRRALPTRVQGEVAGSQVLWQDACAGLPAGCDEEDLHRQVRTHLQLHRDSGRLRGCGLIYSTQRLLLYYGLLV